MLGAELNVLLLLVEFDNSHSKSSASSLVILCLATAYTTCLEVNIGLLINAFLPLAIQSPVMELASMASSKHNWGE